MKTFLLLYIVITCVLFCTTVIGCYFGFCDSKAEERRTAQVAITCYLWPLWILYGLYRVMPSIWRSAFSKEE